MKEDLKYKLVEDAYLSKALYLVERGYIAQDIEKLAYAIYLKEMNNGSKKTD